MVGLVAGTSIYYTYRYMIYSKLQQEVGHTRTSPTQTDKARI